MKKQYSALRIFVAADNGEYSINLKTDTLEGARGAVELSVGDGSSESTLGVYHIDQLIDALNAIKNSNFYYLQESDK